MTLGYWQMRATQLEMMFADNMSFISDKEKNRESTIKDNMKINVQ